MTHSPLFEIDTAFAALLSDLQDANGTLMSSIVAAKVAGRDTSDSEKALLEQQEETIAYQAFLRERPTRRPVGLAFMQTVPSSLWPIEFPGGVDRRAK